MISRLLVTCLKKLCMSCRIQTRTMCCHAPRRRPRCWSLTRVPFLSIFILIILVLLTPAITLTPRCIPKILRVKFSVTPSIIPIDTSMIVTGIHFRSIIESSLLLISQCLILQFHLKISNSDTQLVFLAQMSYCRSMILP